MFHPPVPSAGHGRVLPGSGQPLPRHLDPNPETFTNTTSAPDTNPRHVQDTDAFCRGVLCSPELVELASQQFVCWGGDMCRSDAHTVGGGGPGLVWARVRVKVKVWVRGQPGWVAVLVHAHTLTPCPTVPAPLAPPASVVWAHMLQSSGTASPHPPWAARLGSGARACTHTLTPCPTPPTPLAPPAQLSSRLGVTTFPFVALLAPGSRSNVSPAAAMLLCL